MPANIDFSEFRTLNNYMIRQPLFSFVEISIGGTKVTDFNDSTGDTVMDFSYRRTAHQDMTDVSGDSFTVTLYDDTAIEIESLIYNIILRTTHQADESVADTESGDVEDNTEDNTDIGGEGENEQEDLWVEALEEINNIDISYGWVDMTGNKFLDRSVNGNYSKYSMEFEGASAILTIEGTSLASAELDSPSSSMIQEFSAKKYKGIASDIVKEIVRSVPGLTYKKKTIEDTESILNENGKAKSFIRSGETYDEFIKKYLCEEAKSKKSGKVGYKFYVKNGIAYFLPNETPKDIKVEIESKTQSDGSLKLNSVLSLKSSDYDMGSYDIDIGGGTEFSDDVEDYDGLDDYDNQDISDELDEGDLPEDINDFTGLSSIDIDNVEELSEDELEVLYSDMKDFESDYYVDMEYNDDTDSITGEEDSTEDNEIENNSILGKERPTWLRKFGIKMEL